MVVRKDSMNSTRDVLHNSSGRGKEELHKCTTPILQVHVAYSLACQGASLAASLPCPIGGPLAFLSLGLLYPTNVHSHNTKCPKAFAVFIHILSILNVYTSFLRWIHIEASGVFVPTVDGISKLPSQHTEHSASHKIPIRYKETLHK